jgi:hypothetical protein
MTTLNVPSVSGDSEYNFPSGTFQIVKAITVDTITKPYFGKLFSATESRRVGMYGWYGLVSKPTGGPPNRVIWWKWIEHEFEQTFFPITGNNVMSANALEYFIYDTGVMTFNINY